MTNHNIKRLGIVLEKTSLPFEGKAVLNPTIVQEGGFQHMFYRAVSEKGISSIGYCKLENYTNVVERLNHPVLEPTHDYESRGIEDPRITKIGDTYYLIYVGYDGKNARLCYATSKDLKNFKKHGIISPNFSYKEAEKYLKKGRLKDGYFFFSSYMLRKMSGNCTVWEKDGFLMPQKFAGKFALVHRILPEVQIVFFDDFKDLQNDEFWKDYLSNLNKFILIENTEWFESRNIGAGCPAIETTAGWLLIYHGVQQTNSKRTYSIGAALLDINNPLEMVTKSSEPILLPEEIWELSGAVDNTIFPTGFALDKNSLYIYYGAADERIGVFVIELDNFIRELIKTGIKRK